MGIEQTPDINKIRKELDEKNAEMEKKKRERIKEKYERLSGQEEPTEELIKDEIEESEKKKKEGAEKEIKNENIIQKLIPENIKAAANFKAAHEKGKFIEVKVKISSGKIEDGWVISNINPKTGEATVLKFTSEKEKDRPFIDKIVTLEELKEWNKPEIKDPKEKDKEKQPRRKRAKAEDIKWKKTEIDKEEADKILKGTKEKSKKENKKEKKEKESIEENIKDQLEKAGLDSKEVSKVLPGLVESFKEPEVREKFQELIETEQWQELQDAIEKTMKDSLQKEKEEPESEEKKEKLDPRKSYKKREEVWKEFRKTPDYNQVMDSTLNKNQEELSDYLKQNQSKLSKEAQAWVKEKIKEKEKEDKEKESIEENIKYQLEKAGLDSKEVSKVLPGLVESFKESEVREKFQELIETKQWQGLKDIIEKTMKKGQIPDSVAETKESIEKKEEKKESPWKTVFGTIGWSILLFLVLFMLLELKGVDYLSGQATGKKKEKK